MPCSVAGQTQPSAALHLSGSAGPPHARNSLPLESNSMTDGAGRQQSPSAPYGRDRKSTRLNSSHVSISYAVFCLKKKNQHFPGCAIDLISLCLATTQVWLLAMNPKPSDTTPRRLAVLPPLNSHLICDGCAALLSL